MPCSVQFNSIAKLTEKTPSSPNSRILILIFTTGSCILTRGKKNTFGSNKGAIYITHGLNSIHYKSQKTKTRCIRKKAYQTTNADGENNARTENAALSETRNKHNWIEIESSNNMSKTENTMIVEMKGVVNSPAADPSIWFRIWFRVQKHLNLNLL